MPIEFAPKWNVLQLTYAKSAPHLAAFWLARTRLKTQLEPRLLELFADADAYDDKSKRKDLSAKYKEKDYSKIPGRLEAEHDILVKAAERGKISGPIVRRLAPGPLAGKTTKQLEVEFEALQNERLRIADVDMLKRHNLLSVLVAIVLAKPRFTRDPKVAALFARAVAADGDPVLVTQGVHQSDDPHFDVKMPTEEQQYHLEVEEGPPLKIKSVSYMNGARKSDGTTTVFPDAVVVAPQVVL